MEKRKVLIVVDYQNDFVDGALGFAGAEKIAPRIAEKVRAYRERGDVVAWTFDTHQANYLETREGANLPVEHCLEGTAGHELYPEVAAEWCESDPVFCKETFGSWGLAEWLRARRNEAEDGKPFESIELVGLVSNICVICNAVIAQTACPEVPVVVDAACTGSHDAVLNEKTLDVMEGFQIRVVNRA